MLKLSAILLSQLMLFQSMQISVIDLSNLPNLIEHAQFHKQQYGDSFLDFVMEHYAECQGEQQHSEHKNLPFKNKINQVQQPILLAFTNKLSSEEHIVVEESTPNFFYKTPSTDSVQHRIFQPPKYS